MAKKKTRTASFNFGANAKPRKTRKAASGKRRGNKSNAWRVYVGSNGPIPD